MAIYHCSVKILSRSAGRSSVQFSAYMSGSEMHDDRLNETFTHTSKDEVCYSNMLFTERVPHELRHPEIFWNNVEATEKQSNSQVARTFELALPHELTIEQNIELTKQFTESLIRDGMPAAQFAIHKKDGNWHAHIMAPTRDYHDGKWQPKEKKSYALDENGNKIPILDEQGNQKFRERKGKGKEWLWERKTIQSNPWNNRSMLKEWRKRFADLQNEALEKNSQSVRVDHRSYAEQGIEQLPTIHEGYQARKIEKQGGNSERCEYNRNILEQNKILQAITNEIKKLTEELKQKGRELNERYRSILKRRETTGFIGTNASGTSEPKEYDRTNSIIQREARIRKSEADRENREAEQLRRTLEEKRKRQEEAARRQREVEEKERASASKQSGSKPKYKGR